MNRLDAFAGYRQDGVFVYVDLTLLGRARRWWYRTFWRDCPW